MTPPLFKVQRNAFGRDVYQCLMCANDFPSEEGILRHIGVHEEKVRLSRTSVSCLLLAGRRKFLPGAIRSWASQSWPNKELIVVLDPTIPADLVPSHPGIKVVVPPQGCWSIGARRNLAASRAQGEFLAHWDDDDLRSPYYLEQILRQMVSRRAHLAGDPNPIFQDEEGKLWRFNSASPYLCGASLVYRKDLWEEKGFSDVHIGEDWKFISAHFPSNSFWEDVRVLRVSGQARYLIHEANTSKKVPSASPDYQVSQETPFALLPRPSRLTLGLLTWNTSVVSLEAFRRLLAEAETLRLLGFDPDVLVVDNGSSDGTLSAMLDFLAENPTTIPYHFERNPRNLGNSIARNQMIDRALDRGSEFILFTDGDLEIIPWSTPSLVAYLESHPDAGCCGFHSGGQTKKREEATPLCDCIFTLREDQNQPVAWTQYGLFRMEMFRRGIRFDESGPFGGPGWGFEDNDLYFQMKVAGWKAPCFDGAIYLHRNKHSSIAILEGEGENPEALYEARRQYLCKKWAGVPIINAEMKQIISSKVPKTTED